MDEDNFDFDQYVAQYDRGDSAYDGADDDIDDILNFDEEYGDR